MNPYIMRMYLKKLTLDDVKNISLKNNIILNDIELLDVYNYIKSNYNDYLDCKISDEEVIRDASLILGKDNYNKLYNIYLKYKDNK